MNANSSLSQDTFPSNPITKWFTVKKHVASAGPELAWKIYDAVRTEDYKLCSVFLFEKCIADKLHKPRRREIVTNMLKREVKLLSQLRHCYLLRVVHPIEETSDNIAFATEPVFASLANVLGNQTRLPNPIPQEIQKFRFTDLNRKLGIYQITEVLRFLHLGHSAFHNNICPGAVLITRSGQWRVASISFLEANKTMKKDNSTLGVNTLNTGNGKSLTLDLSKSPWSRKLPKMARPDPRYAAPECLSLTTAWSSPFASRRGRPTPEGQDVTYHETDSHDYHLPPCKNRGDPRSHSSDNAALTDRPGPWSDMFSLGLIICAVYKAGEPAHTSYERQYGNRLRARNNGHVTEDEHDSLTSSTSDTSIELNVEASRVEKLSTDANIPEAFRNAVTRMPMELVEPVEKMLSRASQKRPSSQLFSLLKFFNDPSMLCLDVLISFEDKSHDDRMRALHSIQTNMDRFPKELLSHRFLPMIVELLDKYHRRVHSTRSEHPTQRTGEERLSSPGSQDLSTTTNVDENDMELIRKMIAVVAGIVQKSSPSDYSNYAEQFVIDFIRRCKHVEVKAELLRNVAAFTKHASTQTIEQYLVPIVCDCLECSIPEVQIVAMQSMSEMSGYFQQNELDDIILPGVLQAYSKLPTHLPVRNCALHNLSTLVRQISGNALREHLIPFLLRVTKSQAMNNATEKRPIGRCRSRSSREMVTDNNARSRAEGLQSQISIVCEIWRNVTTTRANVLEPKLVTSEIFPSILPHVLNKDLKVQDFRSVMSALYALLEYLDASVAGSDDSIDTTNYRVIPAVTVDAPASGGRDASPDNSPTRFNPPQPPSTPRRSMVREAVPFVPMLHPKQLKELEQSPGMSRRASAHVIFPLPPGTPVDAPNNHPVSARTQDQSSSSKDTASNSSMSFFGLQLPSVSQLRRHSYDSRNDKSGQEQNSETANNSNTVPKVEIQGSMESLSRRSSENSLVHSRRSFISGGFHSGGMLDSSESRLLTARVCEGPFISAPSSRPGSRRPSGSSVSNWTIDPIPNSTRDSESVQRERPKLLGMELRNVPSSRRSSFNTLGDTVMNLLGSNKVQR